MQKFDAIRPFYDSEINEAILNVTEKGSTENESE